MESKDKVFENFRSLALWLNNEHPNWLKVIRSDNGTEFRNAFFDTFCLEHGIDQQFSAPCVPQQNEVVKRKNYTLVEMARTMLDEHKTPRHFWADTINFMRSILHLTPFELHFGHKPSVSHLRLFGCKCFVLKRENLDKFKSHSFDGILLGYIPHDRSYHVFNLETNIVLESCDMTFNETALCPHDIFECAGDKKIEESIFVDDGLQGVDGDKDNPLLPSTASPFECAGDKKIEESIFVDDGLQGVDDDKDNPLLPSTTSPEHVPASTLEAEASQATTSFTEVVEASWVEGEIVSKPGAPSHIQKAHAPQ
jgi:hypothetical protein